MSFFFKRNYLSLSKKVTLPLVSLMTLAYLFPMSLYSNEEERKQAVHTHHATQGTLIPFIDQHFAFRRQTSFFVIGKTAAASAGEPSLTVRECRLYCPRHFCLTHLPNPLPKEWNAALIGKELLAASGSSSGENNILGVSCTEHYKHVPEAEKLLSNTVLFFSALATRNLFLKPHGSPEVTFGKKHSLFYLAPGTTFSTVAHTWQATYEYLKTQKNQLPLKKFEDARLNTIVDKYPTTLIGELLKDTQDKLALCCGSESDYEEALQKTNVIEKNGASFPSYKRKAELPLEHTVHKKLYLK